MTKRTKTSKRGCLIIVVILIGIICYIVYEVIELNYNIMSQSRAHDLAKAYVLQVIGIVRNAEDVDWNNFQLEYEPREWRKNEDGLHVDCWGNPYRVYMTLAEEDDDDLSLKIRVSFSGRDGVWGTKDDIEIPHGYLLRKPLDWPKRKEALLVTNARLQ